jgi:Icc protein
MMSARHRFGHPIGQTPMFDERTRTSNPSAPTTESARPHGARASRPSVRLVQFTDTHFLPDPGGSLRGARTLPRFEACLAHARRHFFPADAVVVTGDVIHDDPAAYASVNRAFGSLDCPVLMIPGNHDVPDEMARQLGAAPFQVGGEFRTANGWHLLLLESWFAGSTDGEGRLGDAQLDNLDRTLRADAAPHALIFVHHPPLPMDAPALDAVGLRDGRNLCRTIAAHSRVRGVCWGHAHQALDIFGAAGVRWMCTPATSMQFRPRRPTFEADDRPPGYRVLDLGADGSISTEVVWLEGYEEEAVGE